MKSPNKYHLPFLDGLRGAAILAVFLFHSLGASFGIYQLPWDGLFRDFGVSRSFLALYPLTYGSAGVAVFFVVSGFCIHLSYERSKDKSWQFFFSKRMFRIYPPYLVAIVFFAFVPPWGGLRIDQSKLTQLLTHLAALHNFSRQTYFGINPSFWSIAVELQLYAIYPLLFLFTKRFGWQRSLVAVGTLEILLRSASMTAALTGTDSIPLLLTSSPFSYWLSWSLGAYLAECFIHEGEARLLRLPVFAVGMSAFAASLFRPTAHFGFLLFALLTATVIERLMTNKWHMPRQGALSWVWSHLSSLGLVSYSFYLLHQPFLDYLTANCFGGTFAPYDHPLLKFGACMATYPFLFILALIAYRTIELPSVQLGKRFWAYVERRRRSMQATCDGP